VPPCGQDASTQVDLALVELGRIHLDETPLEQVMHRVAELARASIPGAQETSVTVLQGGRPRTIASTSTVAAHLDQRQYERGTGPCLDAARSGGTVSLFRLDREQRYPDFTAVAWGLGLEGTASVGMPARGRSGGALNLYGFSGAALDEQSVRLAQVFAGFAAVALAHSTLTADGGDAVGPQEGPQEGLAAVPADGPVEGAAEAADARDTIERAKGILIARLGCGPDDASAFLLEQSRATRAALADVAADIVRAAQRRTAR
jgi:hypothetical protein